MHNSSDAGYMLILCTANYHETGQEMQNLSHCMIGTITNLYMELWKKVSSFDNGCHIIING